MTKTSPSNTINRSFCRWLIAAKIQTVRSSFLNLQLFALFRLSILHHNERCASSQRCARCFWACKRDFMHISFRFAAVFRLFLVKKSSRRSSSSNAGRKLDQLPTFSSQTAASLCEKAVPTTTLRRPRAKSARRKRRSDATKVKAAAAATAAAAARAERRRARTKTASTKSRSPKIFRLFERKICQRFPRRTDFCCATHGEKRNGRESERATVVCSSARLEATRAATIIASVIVVTTIEIVAAIATDARARRFSVATARV